MRVKSSNSASELGVAPSPNTSRTSERMTCLDSVQVGERLHDLARREPPKMPEIAHKPPRGGPLHFRSALRSVESRQVILRPLELRFRDRPRTRREVVC